MIHIENEKDRFDRLVNQNPVLVAAYEQSKTSRRKPKFRITFFTDGWARLWVRVIPLNFDALMQAKKDWRNLTANMVMDGTSLDGNSSGAVNSHYYIFNQDGLSVTPLTLDKG